MLPLLTTFLRKKKRKKKGGEKKKKHLALKQGVNSFNSFRKKKKTAFRPYTRRKGGRKEEIISAYSSSPTLGGWEGGEKGEVKRREEILFSATLFSIEGEGGGGGGGKEMWIGNALYY